MEEYILHFNVSLQKQCNLHFTKRDMKTKSTSICLQFLASFHFRIQVEGAYISSLSFIPYIYVFSSSFAKASILQRKGVGIFFKLPQFLQCMVSSGRGNIPPISPLAHLCITYETRNLKDSSIAVFLGHVYSTNSILDWTKQETFQMDTDVL